MSPTADRAGAPAFLITIDTEGDNLWAAPREITTRNAEFLPRFQELCEKYGLKPVYLTNFEMALAPAFQQLAKDVLKRGTGEIGMHLHAWNSPPLQPLTPDDFRYQPYLIEYPEVVIREKVGYMTRLLEDTFGVPMRSHRAGRWGMNEVYARVLAENEYLVDCSVTPHVSWRGAMGNPGGEGGPDFGSFPENAYRIDLDDISRPGDSSLLELPMTIMRARSRTFRKIGQMLPPGSLPARVWNRLFPPLLWLRPNGRNLQPMLQVLQQALAERRSYVEFMLHSSEFMPAGSPTFRTANAIERLYGHLDQLFAQASSGFRGATLTEFGQRFAMES